MEEFDASELQQNNIPDTTSPFRQPQPGVSLILSAQLAFSLGLAMLGSFLVILIGRLLGWEGIETLPQRFSADASVQECWQMRLVLGLPHFTTFLLAGLITVWLFYRPGRLGMEGWREYLGINELPSWGLAGLGMLMMLVSIPFILYTFTLNKAIPIPEVFHSMEDQAAESLKALLRMDTIWELAANLLLIAILPALGEELIFRGVLQKQLMRIIPNPWVAITIAAFIFSFIHFQFEGFIPRWLMGFILGWLYWKTNNLWVPVAAHFFNNGLQVIGQYLYGKQLSSVDLEQDIEVPWFVGLIGLLMALAVGRLILSYLKQNSSDH